MKALILAAALSTAFCNTQAPTPTPEPLPQPSTGEFTCADACAQFTRLGCEEATSTPEGASCEDVCGAAQAGPAPLDLGCIARAPSCELARRCE